nr:MAG TPA: hypothetical protein [Caudoviricetes sp.]
MSTGKNFDISLSNEEMSLWTEQRQILRLSILRLLFYLRLTLRALSSEIFHGLRNGCKKDGYLNRKRMLTMNNS